jgi:hypothetical protein
MLIAENVYTSTVAWFQASNVVWDCVLLGFYAASNGSFLPTFQDNSWWLWNSHSGAGEDSSHLGRFILQGQQSKTKALHSTKTSITLHQLTGRNLHQHLREIVMSDTTEDRAGLSYCIWHLLYGSVKIITAFTRMPYWTYFSFHALWYIKTLVNTNKHTILQSVYSFYYM